MAGEHSILSRRRFLATAGKAGAVLAAPMFIPGPTLGKDIYCEKPCSMFIGDEEANRMRSRALRDPWRIRGE